MEEQYSFETPNLGKANIPSPIELSTTRGDSIVNYVKDDEGVLNKIRIFHAEDTVKVEGNQLEIEKEFGLEVAEGVLSLSKNEKLPTKKEQMLDSLARIRQQPQAVWMVKLCDRITNLQPPPERWSSEKISQYRDEARVILEQLGEANQFLADRLKKKIESYVQYLK